MFNIGGFFDKFLQAQSREIGVRNFIIEALKKHTGITVQVNDIDIKGDIIHIKKLPQAAKNALFIKKDVVIDEVNGAQKIKKLAHIKF